MNEPLPDSSEPPPRGLLDATPGPMHPAAVRTLVSALEQGGADPTSRYAEGRRSRALLDLARSSVADSLGVRPDEVSFVPSGPEATLTGLRGLARARSRPGRRGGRVVVSAVEASEVLRWAQARQDEGVLRRAVVAVDRLGRVDLDAWEREVGEPSTVLAALQHANGEVGTMQPVRQAAALCGAHGVPLLVDLSASLGRAALPDAGDVLVAGSASFAGPPGLGLLVVRTGTRFEADTPVPFPEHGHAAAAPWVPQALALAEALRQTVAERRQQATHARELIERVRRCVADIPEVDLVGDPDDRLPHVLTFSVLYLPGETLVDALDAAGFAVASGSACTASTLQPSHVLAAMGALTHGNVRLTLPLPSVSDDLDEVVGRFCAALPGIIARLRAEHGVDRL